MTPEQLTLKYNNEVAEFFSTEQIEGIEVKTFSSQEEIIEFYNKDFDQYGKAPSYLVGFSPGNKIYIIDQDKMPSDYEEGPVRFKKVLKHEIVHKYINQLPGRTTSWLSEGTCCFIAGQTAEKIKREEITLKLLDELSATDDGRKYGVGWFMVNEIVKVAGKEKVIDLIQLPKEKLHDELQKMFDWLK